jgi:phosphomannomutase
VYALLMRYLIEIRGWRGPVVKSINMTSMADQLGLRYGIDVHEVQVGFKNIAPRMLETDAVLGGEESGGFAFRGHMPERDGILTGLFFADMIVRTGKPLSQLVLELEELVGPHAYARHDHHLSRDSYQAERNRVLGVLGDRTPAEVAGVPVARLRSDDGYKFTLADDSWVLMRLSGTEPLIRVYSEAASAQDVDARLKALEDLVEIGRDGTHREGD